jgi:hypothetical protein
MSQGARNCPFFTLIARPVWAAATRRSVWRDRKAGDVDRLGRGDRLWDVVDVGENRAAQGVADIGKERPGRPVAKPRRSLGPEASHPLADRALTHSLPLQ